MHAGWRSRGYLPHFDGAELCQHIVFALADAPLHTDQTADFSQGALRNPALAEIVENVLLHDDQANYRLLAWCVMPSHAHVMIQQVEGAPLDEIVQTWKSVSAHRINRVLKRSGRLWRREYFDRFMRNDEHYASTIHYIEQNPVAAKMVAAAHDWRWSSAWRDHQSGPPAPSPA